jgi:hypothetical protein
MIEKMAFNIGVDFLDENSTNSLDIQNRKEYFTLTQKQIMSIKDGKRISSTVLSEAHESVEK